MAEELEYKLTKETQNFMQKLDEIQGNFMQKLDELQGELKCIKTKSYSDEKKVHICTENTYAN